MIKKAAVLALSAVLTLITVSCAIAGGKTMYNGYLGISIDLPDKYIYEVFAPENLTKTAVESLLAENLAIEEDDNGSRYFGVIGLYNDRPDDSLGIASGIMLAHITDEYESPEDYAILNYESLYQIGDYDGVSVSLRDRGNIEVNGIDYYKLSYMFEQFVDGGTVVFRDEIYVAKLNDAFVTVEIQYYGNDPVSAEFARNFIKLIKKA